MRYGMLAWPFYIIACAVKDATLVVPTAILQQVEE